MFHLTWTCETLKSHETLLTDHDAIAEENYRPVKDNYIGRSQTCDVNRVP
jgi:hypothetical protein